MLRCRVRRSNSNRTEVSNVKHSTAANPKICCVFIPFLHSIFLLCVMARRRPALVSGYKRRILQSLRPHLLLKGDSAMNYTPVAAGAGRAELFGKAVFPRARRFRRTPCTDGENAGMKRSFPSGNVNVNAPHEIIVGD